MNKEHPISDEVLDLAQLALLKGQNHMAYNNSLYFIDKDDVHFLARKKMRLPLQTITSVILIGLM